MRIIATLMYSAMLLLTVKATFENRDKFIRDLHASHDIQKISDVSSNIESILKYLNDKEHYHIVKYLSSGSYGFVFQGHSYVDNKDVKVTDFAFKIMYNGTNKKCPSNRVLTKFVEQKNSPVINLEKQLSVYKDIKESPKRRVFFCILVLEFAPVSLEKTFLPRLNPTNSIQQNTKLFGYVIYRLLRAFDIFNFREGYLHGDIKPANLVVVNAGDLKFEPKIIDFDLTFKPGRQVDSEGRRYPTHVVYTMGYRPFEILQICDNTNCEGNLYYEYEDPKNPGTFITEEMPQMRYYEQYYNFSEEYLEDAYALGVSIKEIFQLNGSRMDKTDPFITFIMDDVVSQMVLDDNTKRLSTQKAFLKVQQEINIKKIIFNNPKMEEEKRWEPIADDGKDVIKPAPKIIKGEYIAHEREETDFDAQINAILANLSRLDHYPSIQPPDEALLDVGKSEVEKIILPPLNDKAAQGPSVDPTDLLKIKDADLII